MARRRAEWHWRGFLRPVHRDPVFWMALGIAALAMVPQMLLLGWDPDRVAWWVRVALQAGLTVAIVLAAVGTGAGIARGWERGLAEAEERHRRR